MRLLLLAVLLALLSPAAGQPVPVPDCSGATAATASGDVCGLAVMRDGRTVNAWLGIPYAEAPVGDLRWAEPQPVQAWSDVLTATSPGNICPQPPNPLRVQGAAAPADQSEDCLYLNVWAPASRGNGQLLPVLAYIHGGAF